MTVWYKNSTSGKTAQITLRNTGSNTWLSDDGTWTASVPDSITLDNNTSYTEYEITFTTPVYTEYYLSLSNDSAASSSIYLDDVSIDDAYEPVATMSDGVTLQMEPGVTAILI